MSLELKFDRLPPLLPRYLRALAPRMRRPGGEPVVPQISAIAKSVSADAGRLAAFARLMGHPPDEGLPPTYPHVLAAPLHLSILTRPEFPLRATGLVHLGNSINVYRSIPVNATMQLVARLVRPERTSRGMEMVMETSAIVDGTTAWTGESRFFARLPGSGRGERLKRQATDGFDEVAAWQAGPGIGRQYAAVSGDYNPIHLSAITARPFGFRAPIAHGMWSLGRTMTALRDRLSAPYHFDVRFRRPLLLPAEVRLMLAADGQFRLVEVGSGKAYLSGFHTEIQQ
ncbi:MAG: hypothetical protein KJO54_12195 [Gammaproteobacteria bacterium]|nr:hypothetical protein [Gammaproteobacteria bacterium]NNF60441.1 hypothetical protein [Gammaproteobacteria bacterium]NNM21787.1 hypothetical protein [Gammaproteobacteria bacterium]